MRADLLIEIGCEDLPARLVAPLSQALRDGMTEAMAREQLAHGEALAYATPRRIAVLVREVADRQPPREIVRRGPAVAAAFSADGQPTRAALGFAASCGVPVEALSREQTGRGEYLVYRERQPGRDAAELLPELFAATLARMDELVPRRMRWGSRDFSFVRPVRWLVALHGERVVPLEAFGLRAGDHSRGHRFHAPEPIRIPRPADYPELLRAARVEPELGRRRKRIAEAVAAEAQRLGGQARIDRDLLDEVASLVEWPVVISGRIDPRFLALPAEVLIATVERHQRYFPVQDADGRLMPAFITVANIESRDVSQVIAGNERVVTPRLADAMFFFEQDRRRPLADYLPGLAQVVFQRELGSMADKVERIVTLARRLATACGVDPDIAVRAAQLCKADLLTQMVGEFPELQGVMGGHYARASGEPEAVAQAIAEHYQPTASGAPIPASPAGRVVALADKLDTLAGIFAIGQAPRGSRDPFALRRAALGVLRILIESGWDLDLRELVADALSLQPAGERGGSTASALLDFLIERLRGLLDAPAEVFQAVAATGCTVPHDFAQRVAAVRRFLELPEAEALAAAHKRARNILRQAGETPPDVDPALLREPAEQALHEALDAAGQRIGPLLAARDYVEALRALAALREPIDRFFDAVMVMAEDASLRDNRLALLGRFDRLCRCVADLSELPG